jgi:F-type H+-transporting ATPase subunit b
MFATPEFWVFIAFILFVALFGKRGTVFLTQLLDQHRFKVTQQLDEAQRLHDEALSLLNSYKKKNEEALEQASNIMASAEKEALAFQKSSEVEFQKLLAQKEKALLERIVLETEATKSKLRNQAADEALAIVENLLSKDSKQREKLTKASLKEISDLDLKLKR